mgnify:CR=1 FL=1
MYGSSYEAMCVDRSHDRYNVYSLHTLQDAAPFQ